jgi:hypothetical protein
MNDAGLYALHVDLMLGGADSWLIGLVPLAWLPDLTCAAVLSLPKTQQAAQTLMD